MSVKQIYSRKIVENLGELDDSDETPKCAGKAPIFDDEIDGETPTESLTRMEAAVGICLTCPLIIQCRELARAANGKRTGIYGGMFFSPHYTDGVHLSKRYRYGRRFSSFKGGA